MNHDHVGIAMALILVQMLRLFCLLDLALIPHLTTNPLELSLSHRD